MSVSDLEQSISALKVEISSVEKRLEAAEKDKTDYGIELLNKYGCNGGIAWLEKAVDGHIGYANDFTIPEITTYKLLQDKVREIKNKLLTLQWQDDRLRKEIAIQQSLAAARHGCDGPIQKINNSLNTIREAYAELEAIRIKHQLFLRRLPELPYKVSIQEMDFNDIRRLELKFDFDQALLSLTNGGRS